MLKIIIILLVSNIGFYAFASSQESCLSESDLGTYDRSGQLAANSKDNFQRMTGDQHTGIYTWSYQLSFYESILVLHASDHPEQYKLPYHPTYDLEDVVHFVKESSAMETSYKQDFFCYMQEVVEILKR